MTLEASPDRVINHAFLLGGVTAAIFGVVFLIRQEEALSLAVILLGIWWLIQGTLLLFSALIDTDDRGWKVFLGALGLAAGIIVLADPSDAAAFLGGSLAVALGIIGVLIGLSAVFGSFRGAGFGALVFGTVSVAGGLLFIFNSAFSFSLLVTLFGILLLIDGVAAVFVAIRFK